MKRTLCGGLLGRRKPPALEVPLRLGRRHAVLVDHQRGIEVRRAERIERLRDSLRQLAVELDAVTCEGGVRSLATLAVERDLRPQLGDSL